MPDVDQVALATDADEETAPTSLSGFCVAESPMRWNGPASASSRSSESARCDPRLSRASAWISSTMTVLTVLQHLAAAPRW